jgi:hypothetical protein
MDKLFRMKHAIQKSELLNDLPLSIRIVGEGTVSHNATCFKDDVIEVYINEYGICYPKKLIEENYE